jgi:hypothetical protein
MDIEKINFANHHWFLFYRKFIRPLRSDFYCLNVVARTCREGHRFKENAPNAVMVGSFFDTKRVSPGSLPIGSSKMCGDPDLPEDLIIPKNYAFVCQLNLSELSADLAFSIFHPGLKNTQFPKKGILYFFADPRLNSGAVYYYNGDVTKLKRRKLQRRFNSYECAIKVYEHLTMDAEYCRKFTTDGIEEWWETSFGRNPFHSLFGYANPLCRGRGRNYLLQIRNDLDFGIGFKGGSIYFEPYLYFVFDEDIQFDEGFIKIEVGTLEYHPFG